MKRLVLHAVLFGTVSLAARSAPGQGCSQCKEALGQTPQRTQTAYRRGIALLVIAGGGVFGGALLTMRRFR